MFYEIHLPDKGTIDTEKLTEEIKASVERPEEVEVAVYFRASGTPEMVGIKYSGEEISISEIQNKVKDHVKNTTIGDFEKGKATEEGELEKLSLGDIRAELVKFNEKISKKLALMDKLIEKYGAGGLIGSDVNNTLTVDSNAIDTPATNEVDNG